MNLYNLLFLEERNCNWANQLQQDKDIGQDEFVIFNSGYLVSLMLTYDEARRQKPFKELHKDLIRYFWPELLNYPLNPSFKNKVVTLIARMKLLGPAIRLKSAKVSIITPSSVNTAITSLLAMYPPMGGQSFLPVLLVRWVVSILRYLV